jgi:hypothetical protein
MESVTASQRALIVLGVVLFLVGAAAGFGVGFGVGHNQTKTVVKAARATTPTSARRIPTPAQTQRFNQLLSCMADHGVKWPSVPGGPLIGKPPVGVSQAKYNTAFAACYRPTGASATTTT